MFVGEAFKEVNYVFPTVAMSFVFLGMWTPLFVLPTYAVSRGMDATLASNLLAIANMTSTFGRIIPGILADKYGRLNIVALGGIFTGVVLSCMNEAEAIAALAVYAIVLGFSSGTIISGGVAAFTVCPKDPRNTGTYRGMGMAMGSVSALIGLPFNEVFVSRHGAFLNRSHSAVDVSG